MKSEQEQNASGGQKMLLLLVIGMGLALIGGTALLIGKIINKNKPQPAAEAVCSPQRHALAEEERALVLAVEGQIATFEIRRPGPKESIMLRQVDLCSGKAVSELTVH